MSMSTHVVGFKPPDEKWRQMKAVYDACTAAKCRVPQEVWDFFGGDVPDPSGVTVPEGHLLSCGAVKPYTAEMENGYEIDIAKLPADVKIVRVYNSF